MLARQPTVAWRPLLTPLNDAKIGQGAYEVVAQTLQSHYECGELSRPRRRSPPPTAEPPRKCANQARHACKCDLTVAQCILIADAPHAQFEMLRQAGLGQPSLDFGDKRYPARALVRPTLIFDIQDVEYATLRTSSQSSQSPQPSHALGHPGAVARRRSLRLSPGGRSRLPAGAHLAAADDLTRSGAGAGPARGLQRLLSRGRA